MCHCREAKDRKYHKPNKEQTPRPPTVVRTHFISRITGFADVLDISFSLIIKSIPKLILEVIRGKWACRDLWATSTCYMFANTHSVFSEACCCGGAFILLSFGFDLFGAHKCPSSCRPEPQEHDRTASTSAELLVAFTLNKACFCGFLPGRTCNLELRCGADQFTITLLVTRVKVEHQQR